MQNIVHPNCYTWSVLTLQALVLDLNLYSTTMEICINYHQVTQLNEGVELESMKGLGIDKPLLAQGFLEEDKDFEGLLGEGGTNPSKRVDQWTLNQMNEFKRFKSLDQATCLR